MNLPTYKEAVSQLSVPKLTAFLKLVSDYVEIEGWSKMKAPEKKENVIEALTQSKELRKEFVVFYAEETGNEADFSEWEMTDADANPPAETEDNDPGTEDDVSNGDGTGGETETKGEVVTSEATAPATISAAPTAFVEGAFEQIVSDVAGLDANQSRTNLQEAEYRMEFEHIRIGALLAHIQSSQHYITLGYDNMREFLAAETALDYRKGTYLISNYARVRDLGIPADALKGVTWSALRHVVPILTDKNYKKWLDAARSNTHVKLIEQVAKEKAKQQGALPAPTDEGGDEGPQPITKAFNVFPDQDVTIKAAIEKAKGQANVDSNGAALEVIAAAYTGAPVSDSTVGLAHPDLSEEGFKTMFSKLKAEGGNDALVPILNAIDAVWSEVDITAAFPEGVAAE